MEKSKPTSPPSISRMGLSWVSGETPQKPLLIKDVWEASERFKEEKEALDRKHRHVRNAYDVFHEVMVGSHIYGTSRMEAS